MRPSRRGVVGHADLAELVIALRRGGHVVAPGLAAGAELIEYEPERPQAPAESAAVPTLGSSDPGFVGTAVRGAEAAGDELEPLPLWQPRSCEWSDGPVSREISRLLDGRGDAEADAAELSELAEVPPPVAPPIGSMRRVLPLVRRALTRDQPSDELDVDALVRQLGRGEPLTELPYLPRRAWPSVLVLADRDFGLVPLWNDQEHLLDRLRHAIGATSVVIRFIDESGPERGVFDVDGRPASLHDAALVHLPVLALTDLGWCRSASHRMAWLRVGRRLRRGGRRLHALVPVPRVRWSGALARVWSPVPWERPAPGDEAAVGSGRQRRVSRLLDLAALAHRLEPGLLRALRYLLPREHADLGTELDAWQHEDLASQFPVATVLRPDRVEHRRKRVLREQPAVAAAAAATLRAWHWHRELGPEVWHAEALALGRVDPPLVPDEERRRAEAFAERLGRRTRLQVRSGVDPRALDGLRRWLDYVQARSPTEVWRPDTRAGRGLQLAWWATHDADHPPPDADPKLRALLEDDAAGVEREVVLRQVGCELVGGVEGSEGGSPVVSIAATDSEVFVHGERGSQPVPFGGDVRIEARAVGALELRTDRVTVKLEPLTRPGWASAIGRDRFGLWADWEFRGVVQRMRWIPPGRFVMGSPDDEPGRDSDEGPVHTVTITRGYWLGDTPVTQALWKATTGEEPSRFKSADRPVEQVSWDDCQTKLIAALNAEVPADRGEAFRLPTEAEWEHACRAGTQTATYAEPIEIRGVNDAPVLDDIAWYGGNSGVDFDLDEGEDSSGWKQKQYEFDRAGTRVVKGKLPNPWGLYDMLGNVWEWCADGMRSYDADSRVVHVGPTSTGEPRVNRGGSWIDTAGGVRAAYRYANHPGYRNRVLGLRLVRAQAVRTDPAPEGK